MLAPVMDGVRHLSRLTKRPHEELAELRSAKSGRDKHLSFPCLSLSLPPRHTRSPPPLTLRRAHDGRSTEVKKRLEKLAKSTGRSRSFLAAEALREYLDVNEWQVAGIRRAIGSLDRGGGVSHEQVESWVNSWGGKRERSAPKKSAR